MVGRSDSSFTTSMFFLSLFQDNTSIILKKKKKKYIKGHFYIIYTLHTYSQNENTFKAYFTFLFHFLLDLLPFIEYNLER